MIRRRESAFVTVMANRLAALASDAREAELSEHVGRDDECNSILVDVDRKLRDIGKAFGLELERRQISADFTELKARRC